MTDRELLALIRALSRIGGPLANAVSPALGQGIGGLGSLVGLAGSIQGGNIPGAIGSAAGVGSQIANLAGMPGVSNALGSVAGPLALGTSLANGNWGGAVGALPSTISAGASLGGQLGLLSPQLVNSLTPMMGALAFPAALLTVALTAEQSGGQDIFDSLFGGAKSQAQKQIEEHKNYVERFPGLVADRARGASLLDTLGTLPTDQVGDALSMATKGIRATDLSPAYSHLAQPHYSARSELGAKIPGIDMSWWEKIAPELEGKNWASFVGLLDKATNQGLDVNAIAGDRNRQVAQGQGHVFAGPDGVNVDADPRGLNSQSAYDLSNAIAGIGQQLGINWGARGNEQAGENQGYTLFDDQLAAYGFEPGKQGAAALKYLTKLDPNVTQHANWQQYKDALGVTDDMLNGIPDYQVNVRHRLPTIFEMPGVGPGGEGDAGSGAPAGY
jgi:hypothetical protein